MSKPTARAKRIVREVLRELFYDRRGLTQEWDSIDKDVKAEIRRVLISVVQVELDRGDGDAPKRAGNEGPDWMQ
ncbi:MAG: hypothetical protein U0804_28565 [Gemmataceae bacterium]